MERLGWLVVLGLLGLGAASDAGLSPVQQRALVERVDRLERDVAQLKSVCRAPAAGGLRVEDQGGQPLGGGGTSPQLTPQQVEQLRRDAEKIKQNASTYQEMLKQLEDSP